MTLKKPSSQMYRPISEADLFECIEKCGPDFKVRSMRLLYPDSPPFLIRICLTHASHQRGARCMGESCWHADPSLCQYKSLVLSLWYMYPGGPRSVIMQRSV